MDVERAIDVLVAYLATYAVHGALLGALALFVARKAADRAPVAVERLLRAALLGALLTAALPFVFGFEPLCGRFALLSCGVAADTSAVPETRESFVAGLRANESVAAEPASFGVVGPDAEGDRAPASAVGATAGGAERACASDVEFGGFGSFVASDARDSSRATHDSDALDRGGRPLDPAARGSSDDARFATRTEPRATSEFTAQTEGTPASSRSVDWPASIGAPSIELLPLAMPTFGGVAPSAVDDAFGFAANRLVVLLLVVWLAGVTVGVVRAARDLRALRRALRWRTELRGGPVRAMLDELCDRAGMTRRVRLSIAPCTHVPLSFGLIRPEIGLPPRTLEDLGEDEQRAVLAHELAHLARRDILWLWLARALGIAFWFQPLQRRVARELERRAEFAADLWARGRIGSGAPLASALAEIAGWLVEERRSLPAAPMARERSQLVRRVELLLEHETAREPRAWSGVAPLACAVVAAWSPAFGGNAAPDGSNELADVPSDADAASDDVDPALERVAFEDAGESSTGAEPETEPAHSLSAAEPALHAELVHAGANRPEATHAESTNAETSGLDPAEELDAWLDRARSPREVFEVAALALDLEVEALETELADLERELAAGDPDAEIEAELGRLRERVDRLLESRGRMRELFLALTDELGAARSAHLDAPDAAFAAPEQDTARHAFFPEESR